jgi:hypothetical protein
MLAAAKFPLASVRMVTEKAAPLLMTTGTLLLTPPAWFSTFPLTLTVLTPPPPFPPFPGSLLQEDKRTAPATANSDRLIGLMRGSPKMASRAATGWGGARLGVQGDSAK